MAKSAKLSPQDRARYKQWEPVLKNLVRLELTARDSRKWRWACRACGAVNALQDPRIAQFHDAECPWLATWMSTPEDMREHFMKSWEFANATQHLMLRLD